MGKFALRPIVYQEVAVCTSWDHLRIIADTLALDPHAEAANRDVQAALELLS